MKPRLWIVLAVVTACSPVTGQTNQKSQTHAGHATNNAPDSGSPRAEAASTSGSDGSSDAPSFTDEEALDICETAIRKTRSCKDLYLPALLRTRAKYDQPPGIAARYEQDGEKKLLAIASQEFDRDFSEQGIAQRCTAMMEKPRAERDWIVAREKSCLPSADSCSEFVACNMELLDKKWGPGANAGPKSG
jgi:hypothetical protein